MKSSPPGTLGLSDTEASPPAVYAVRHCGKFIAQICNIGALGSLPDQTGEKGEGVSGVDKYPSHLVSVGESSQTQAT